MALDTIADVTAKIREIVDGEHPNGMKPAERRIRAALLADLYEVRASMWADLGLAADLNDAIPDVYATACSVAIKHDRGQVTFFRTQAGAR